MNNYINLQFKRFLKLFPFVLVLSTILFIGLVVVFSGFMTMNEQNPENKMFQIGICGDIDNNLFKIGKKALETIDSSRFTLSLTEMDEETARKSLEKGTISAYVVFPKDFISLALKGEIKPIEYVTSAGSYGVTSIVKDELTKSIELLLSQSQKGVFGLENLLIENEIENNSINHIDKLNLRYIDFILNRSNMYKTTELGISNGLSLPEYLLCGIGILFFLIIGLPYALVLVKKDLYFNKFILAKGYSITNQIIIELFVFYIMLLLTIFVVFSLVGIIYSILGSMSLSIYVPEIDVLNVILCLFPIIAMISSFNIMIFEITDDIKSGVLLQFIVSLSLCYITGCLYPIYTFPAFIQKISYVLPTGLARSLLSNSFYQDTTLVPLLGVILYTLIFFCTTIFIRNLKINKKT